MSSGGEMHPEKKKNLTASTGQTQAAGNRGLGLGWVGLWAPQVQIGHLGPCRGHWGALWGAGCAVHGALGGWFGRCR